MTAALDAIKAVYADAAIKAAYAAAYAAIKAALAKEQA